MSLFAIAWFLFWGGAWLLVSPHIWRIVFTFERVEAQIVGHGFKDGDALLTLKILQGQFQGQASWLALPNTSTVGYPSNKRQACCRNQPERPIDIRAAHQQKRGSHLSGSASPSVHFLLLLMKLKNVLKEAFMVIALFVVHALISAGAFLWHYSLSAGRFDGHAGSALALQLAQVIKAVCFFPFASILFEWVPLGGVWGWMPVVVNSAVVAVSVILASTVTRQR